MIRNVVFDIGRVLIDLGPGPLIRLLEAHGSGRLSLEQIVARIRLHDHESGRIGGRELLADLARLAPQPIPHEELRAGWLDMFAPQEPMMDLARGLTGGYRVFLLSNVGDLHWAHLSETYDMHRLGHGALPSFVAGVIKPDPAIYAQAEQRLRVVPAETVFIDDRPENIDAAVARGWRGIRHCRFEDTVAALAALDVAP